MGQEMDAKFDRAIVNPIGGPSFTYQDLLELQNFIAGIVVILTNPSAPTVLTHEAQSGQYIIVKGSSITINLPDPSEPLRFVRVKVDGSRTLVKLFNASGVDGFGTEYTLESSYESVSLISDGTQWYII